jgi:hypothetical protein
MKKLLFFLFMGCGAVYGQTMVYPTVPGTNMRDYTKSGLKIEDNIIKQTIPGTSMEDFSKPRIKIEYYSNDIILKQTYPGTNMEDFTKPRMKVEADPYPVLEYPDYSTPAEEVGDNDEMIENLSWY